MKYTELRKIMLCLAMATFIYNASQAANKSKNIEAAIQTNIGVPGLWKKMILILRRNIESI